VVEPVLIDLDVGTAEADGLNARRTSPKPGSGVGASSYLMSRLP